MNASMWTDMFVLAVPIFEKIIRTVLVYFFLIIGLRLAGKRELAQLNPFDLVVLLTLSNTVQNAIIGNDNSITGGLIGAAALLFLNYLVVRALYGHKNIENLVAGSEDVLIDNGIINYDVLKREVISLPELEMAAHKQGFGGLDEIERAILEPGGAISFIGIKPEPDLARHQELLDKLDTLTREVADLRSQINGHTPA